MLETTLEKLCHLLVDVGALRKLSNDWPNSEVLIPALDKIMLMVEEINRSLVESSVFQKRTDTNHPVTYFKHQLLSQAKVFSPEWAVLDLNETSLLFCRLFIQPNSIRVGNYLKIELRQVGSGGHLILVSTLNGINVEIVLRPDELFEKIVALLKCCRESSVFLERRELTQSRASQIVVKRENKAYLSEDVGVENGNDTEVRPLVVVKKEVGSDLEDVDGGNHQLEEEEHDIDEFQSVTKERQIDTKSKGAREVRKRFSSKKTAIAEAREKTSAGVSTEDSMRSDGTYIEDCDNRVLEINENDPAVQKLDTKYSPQLHVRKLSKDVHLYGRYWKLRCRVCQILLPIRRGSHHMLDQHGISGGDCCFCPRTFQSRKEVILHQRNDHAPDQLACRLCDKGVYTSPASVTNHMLRAHGISKAECCFCPREFDEKTEFSTHVRLCHRKLTSKRGNCRPCKICKVPLRRDEEYGHLKSEHDKPNECPLCDFKATGAKDDTYENVQDMVLASVSRNLEEQLKRHIRWVHRRKLSKCIYCHAGFESPELAAEHRKTCQKKADGPKMLCNVCGQLFTRMQISNHRRICHQNSYRWACPHCPNKYINGSGLKRHLLRIHFPEKKEHICVVCGKSFTGKDSLTKHSKMHEQPTIKCTRESCDKVFKWKQGVMQHLRGCHYPPQWECVPCQKRFAFKCVVRTHLKQIHLIVETEEFIVKHPNDESKDFAKLEGYL